MANRHRVHFTTIGRLTLKVQRMEEDEEIMTRRGRAGLTLINSQPFATSRVLKIKAMGAWTT